MLVFADFSLTTTSECIISLGFKILVVRFVCLFVCFFLSFIYFFFQRQLKNWVFSLILEYVDYAHKVLNFTSTDYCSHFTDTSTVSIMSGHLPQSRLLRAWGLVRKPCRQNFNFKDKSVGIDQTKLLISLAWRS